MIRKYLSILLILFCYCNAQSQITSSSITSGIDFWLAYRNISDIKDSLSTMQIRIVTDCDVAQGQITFTSINDTIPFQVSRGEVFIYNLTEAQRLATNPPDTAEIVNKSIHITSDTLINVFAGLQSKAISDATAILPTSSLDTTYRYVSFMSSAPTHSDKICIIATANNTKISMNDSIVCTLQKGEVFYCTYSRIPNKRTHQVQLLLSAYIVSNYPIACFTMYCAIKSILFDPRPSLAGDGIFCQMSPVSMSGNQYFIPINRLTGEEILKMVANRNYTNISFTRAATVGFLDKYENMIATDDFLFLISSDTLGCIIESNNPISLYSILSKLNNNDGDPSQAWIPPYNLRIQSSTIAPFFFSQQHSFIRKHYAVVLTPYASRLQTTVRIGKDSVLPISSIPMVQRDIDSTYTVFEVPLYQDSVSYTFSNLKGGVLVWCLGIGYFESYYYLAGAAKRKMEIDFTANDIPSVNLNDTFFCDSLINIEGKVIQKNTTYPYTIKWYINGIEDTTLLNKMQWDRFFPRGHYSLKMKVLFDTEVGINELSIEDSLHVEYLLPKVENSPENCSQQNGRMEIFVESSYPKTVVYQLNGEKQKENVFDSLSSGKYQLKVQDKYCTYIDTIELSHIDGPVAAYQIATKQPLDKGDIVTFIDTSKEDGGIIIERDWDLGDGNKKEGTTIEHAYLTSGRYTVKLTVIDENNCKDSTSQDIVVQGDISFPNVYTPYGEDGKRYYFRPMEDESHYQQLEITIYNRWGNKIWHRKCQSPECPNYQEDNFWWDGTNSQGKMVSDGVYYWVLTAIYESPQLPPLHKEGTVTVINGK